MRTATNILDDQYMEMRWRILSLAADFDRIERGEGGADLLETDPRIRELRECLKSSLENRPGRAERVQQILSDKTPPPR